VSSGSTGITQRPIERIGNDPATIAGKAISECGEPLVAVVPQPGIAVAPAYHQRGIRSASEVIQVRAGVLDALRRAAGLLPSGVQLLLWDGLRNLHTQAEIVQDFRDSLPEPGSDAVVEKYLASPPVSEAEFLAEPPPHSTGGAVDLTLCDSAGRPLEMGADFDEFDEPAWLAYFENASSTALAATYRDNRRTLYWAMIEAGFAPYPWEYWHYEIGTSVAAVFHDLPFAKYGAAVPWN